MPAQVGALRDAGLARLRSLNTGMVVAGVAAIGLASAGVAAAAPGHRSAPSTGGQTPTTSSNSSTTSGTGGAQQQQPQQPQQVNPNTNPPVVTSGGS